MINYLFSGYINDEAKHMLAKDLHKAKRMAVIAASDNPTINDLYLYEGNDSFDGIIPFYKSFTAIEHFDLLDHRTSLVDAREILLNADVIYLTGGDPMCQINYIFNNNLEDIIKSFKGVVIGLSAGSMNQGKVVFCGKGEEDALSSIYLGLDLVKLTVQPHYSDEDVMIKNELVTWGKKLSILALYEESFVRVENECIEVYGKYQMFNNDNENNI